MEKEKLYFDEVKEFEFKPEAKIQKLLDAEKRSTAEFLAKSTGKSPEYWLERIKVVTIKFGMLIKDDEGLLSEPAPSEVFMAISKSTLPIEVREEFGDE